MIETNNVTTDKVKEEMKSVFLKRASIKRAKLNPEMNLESILDENIFKLGHILLDLHESFGIKPSYEPLTEFETFKTVGDIEKYLTKRVS